MSLSFSLYHKKMKKDSHNKAASPKYIKLFGRIPTEQFFSSDRE